VTATIFCCGVYIPDIEITDKPQMWKVLMPVRYRHSLQTQIDAVITRGKRVLFLVQTRVCGGSEWKIKSGGL